MNIGIEQLEAALADLNVLIAYLDADLRFVHVNGAYAAAASKTPDFFVGKKHFELYPNAGNEALFRDALASGTALTIRAKAFDHPDQPDRGTTYWDWSLQPIMGKANSSPVALALILIDVTDPVRTAQQAQAQEQQLAEKEESLRALLNATQECAMLIEDDGTLLALNDMAARGFGTTAEAALGSNVYELMPAELAKSRREIGERLRRTREAVTFEDRRDARRLSNTIYPLIGADGEVHRAAIYSKDITELRQLEDLEELASAVNQMALEGAAAVEVLHLLCARITDIFDLPLAWIGRKEADGGIYIAASAGTASGYLGTIGTIGVRWDDTPLGRGPAGAAVRTGKMQIHKRSDSRFRPWAERAAEFGLNAVMSVPLIVRGQVYGALILCSRQKDHFDSAAMQGHIANLAGKICLTLGIAAEHQQVRLLGTALAAASNAIMIADREGVILWVNAAFCRLSGYAEDELLGHTPNILKSGRHDERYYQGLWRTILGGDTWTGETTDRRKDGSEYTVLQTITPIVDEDGVVTHFVTVHEDVTERLEAQARILHLAHHDVLTGLPNRVLFFDRMHQACGLAARDKFDITLLYMDLDGFKDVNDGFGHDIGDLLLQEVAQRMQSCIRTSDTLARLGGDEFGMILFDPGGFESTERIAEKLLAEIGRPFFLGGHQMTIGVSIGIALGGTVCDQKELLRRADVAMYAAKRAGKHGFSWYEGDGRPVTTDS